MHKGTVVNLGQFNNLFAFLKNNWCLITLTISFLFGVTFGIFTVQNGNQLSEFFIRLAESFITLRTEREFLSIFLNSLYTNISFLILILIFGTSVTGITLAPILISARGCLFGAIAGVFYSEYSLKGIALNALVLIPPTIIAVIFLIVSAREAMKLSLTVIAITLPESKPKNLSFHFGAFCKRSLILIIPIIFSALLDGWLSIKLISFLDI